MVDVMESRDAATLREEVRSWLAESWDADRPEQEWFGMLADTGWGWPTWPRDRYGRGLPDDLAQVVYEEFFRAGATPGVPVSHNGLTVRDFCTDEQARTFLRPLLTGEDRWCQLFSEPSAGSDLAGLQTRADRHGDEWIVNGQKVWTSGAVGADYGILLARTDWDVPKHQGITMFLYPMKQAGTEVRPIKQMTGGATFNEVFFTDSRVPHPLNLLGSLNAGWSIAMRTLSHERNRGRDAARTAARARLGLADDTANRVRMGFDVRSLGPVSDPVLRQRIAHLYSLQQVSAWTNQRAAAARKAGKMPGPEVSIGKLAGARIGDVTANLRAAVAGASAMLADTPATQNLLSYKGGAIAAGTDEVQRNIMGERVLGLPKEPQVDVDIAFRQVQKSSATRSFSGKQQ